MKKKNLIPFLMAFFTTIVQCYDYALFGFSAAILARHFMPPDHLFGTNQISLFFAIFSFAAFARPVGSILFGAIADNYGRVVSIKIAILLAAASTILLGIMPNFATISWIAPALLTLCRMTFLMSLSGKSDTLRVYVFEKADAGYKNFANGLVSFCTQIGAVLAAVACYLTVDGDNLWRLNFIIGGSLGIVLILLRHYIKESEEFIDYQKRHRYKGDSGTLSKSIAELAGIIRQNRLKFTLAILISGSVGGIFHFFIIFLSTFAAEILQVITPPQRQIMNISLIASYGLIAPLSGLLADKFNVKKQLIGTIGFSLITIIGTIFVLDFIAVETIMVPLYFASILLTVLITFYAIPLQIIQQAMFAVNIRMRMFSLSHSLGSIIFSASTPFVCNLIWSYTGSLQLMLGYVTALFILLTWAVITLLKLYTAAKV